MSAKWSARSATSPNITCPIPQRAFEAQTALTTQFINLWAATLQRFQGAPAKPVAEPDRSDKRFSDAEWRDNPFFDFLKQAYVLTTRWADDLVRRADELEPHERDKAQFYLRQVTAALSPSNFIGTNPELLRATLEESGENLVRGLKMLAEDIEAGKGNLRIRQSDARAFKLGVNMATTPGKVIFRNELIELIQYEPTTPEVYKRPLLIVPPWINKFYILDLNPEKSFIRWAVAQGLTVFVISWVNPDERHADKDFDAYMHEGILAALDCVEQATGEREVTAIGYCVGGTLLAATLGYMAAVGDKRINSVDLLHRAGRLHRRRRPQGLRRRGATEGGRGADGRAGLSRGLGHGPGLQHAAAERPHLVLLRQQLPQGQRADALRPPGLELRTRRACPPPTTTSTCATAISRTTCRTGAWCSSGKTIDLEKVTIPIYELASREDHIAPARGVFRGAKCFGGPVRFVLAGSGHIAGVVNPADKPKYQFWTDGPPEGDFESWLAAAKETPGSWWPDWIQWIAAQAPGEGSRPQAGRRQAEGDLRRAGRICAGEGVTRAPRGGGRIPLQTGKRIGHSTISGRFPVFGSRKDEGFEDLG